MKPIRMVIISDTHEKHRDLILPRGDILIHSGDFTKKGDIKAICDFNSWLGSLPFKHKIVVAGNHDYLFEDSPEIAEGLLANATYLKDSSVVINGIKFYGSPWQPEFFDLAFNLPRGGDELARVWASIPDDTGVLITHCPPEGTLDVAHRSSGPVSVGCSQLAYRIEQLKMLRLHVFGHIHESYGVIHGKFTSANASSCDRRNEIANTPLVFEIDEDSLRAIRPYKKAA